MCRRVAFIVLLFCCSSAIAQKGKAYNRLYISYSREYYLDKQSVKRDGIAPENHINAWNTNAPRAALQYERVMASGLTVGMELAFGLRKYEMVVVQDMTNFDPDGVDILNKQYGVSNGKIEPMYLGPKLLVGYRLKLKRNWAIAAKVGIGVKLFYNGNDGSDTFLLKYRTDNGRRVGIPAATTIDNFYGRPVSYTNTWKFPVTLPSYECYFGVEKELNARFLKNISVGIEGSRGWWMWDRHETAIIHSSTSVTQLLTSKEIFIDRNISFGLRVAVGLWK